MEGSEAWRPPGRFDWRGTLKQEIKYLHFSSWDETRRERCRVGPPGSCGRRLLQRVLQLVFTACADFEGKVVKTSVVFHKLGTAMPMSVEEGPEYQGPVVS